MIPFFVKKTKFTNDFISANKTKFTNLFGVENITDNIMYCMLYV